MELLPETFILFVTLFVMMAGLILTLVPVIPGPLIIWGAAVGYGLLLGWPRLGWLAFGLMTFFLLLGLIADALGGQFGAKVGGASCLAIALGTIFGFMVGILGSFFGTPLVGCLLGVVATLGGILLVERLRYKDWRSALNATKGYLAGTTLGLMARVTSGVLMMIVFVGRVYWWG